MRRPQQEVPLEDDEQALLFEWAEWNTTTYPSLSMLYAIPNGGYRKMATARRMKKTGTKKGVPDVCLPVSRGNYNGLYIEMKRAKGGRASDEQKWWLEHLTDQGYRAVICKGFAEARDELISYLETKPERI